MCASQIMVFSYLAILLACFPSKSIGICSSPQGPIQNLNKRAGDWLNIFVDLPMGCSGAVDLYEFYAINKGVFYASFWRELEGANETWFLVGSNKIEVNEEGPQNHTIALENQIIVQAGDYLGIYYDEDAPGVVPYEMDTLKRLWKGSLSRLHNGAAFSSDLHEGSIKQGLESRFLRRPALNAYVQECDTIPLDVLFAIDESNSIDGQMFAAERDFVKLVYQAMHTGDPRVRVAFMAYAEEPYLFFNFDDHQSSRGLARGFSSAAQDKQPANNASLSVALEYGLDHVFTRSRNSSRSLMVMLMNTDPIDEETWPSTPEPMSIDQIDVIGIAVGFDPVGLSSFTRLFTVETVDDLQTITEKVAFSACATHESQNATAVNDY